MAERLTALLRRRGVDPHTSEDIIQEVAARALATEVPFASADDLYPWAATVARNLAADDWRARRRLATAPPGDQPAPTEVSSVVEKRVALGAVSRGLAELAPTDREAIMAGVTGSQAGPSRRDDIRLAVRRHRARARLARMCGGLVSALGALWSGRRLLDRGRVLTRVGAAAMPLAMVLTVSLSIPDHETEPALEGRQPGAPFASTLPIPRVPVASTGPAGGGATTASGSQAPVSAGGPAATADPYAPLYRRVVAGPPGGPAVGTQLRKKVDQEPLVCVEALEAGRKTCVEKVRSPEVPGLR